MRLSMLIAGLIIVNGCAGRSRVPDPPRGTECMNLPAHFACTKASGQGFNLDYPAAAQRMHCEPWDDWEARKNWEGALR